MTEKTDEQLRQEELDKATGPISFFNAYLGYVPSNDELRESLVENGYELTDLLHLDRTELLECLWLELADQ